MSLEPRNDDGRSPSRLQAKQTQGSALRVLHIDNIIGETCASYNEHVLPKVDEYELTVCTYFPSPIEVSETISFFAGKGSVSSYWKTLARCLRSKDFDIIHVHAPHAAFFTFFILLVYKATLLRSTVYTIHSSFPNYSTLHRCLLLIPFLFFRRLIHCSWSSYHSFPSFYRFLGGSRLTAVPNGVNLQRVDRCIAEVKTKCHKSVGSDNFHVLAIGRLIPVKNLFTLVNAVKKAALPDLLLHFLGEGDLRKKLTNAIHDGNLNDSIKLRGLVARDAVYQELLDADLFVSTSLIEGLPMSVLEAMSCRCPVILSDIPSHRELAKDVDFVPLIEPNDSIGFSIEIARIYALNRSKREELGRKCRELVEQHYSLDVMHRGYFDLYSKVLC